MNNIDRYGHCCLCHKNMIIERVVDQKVIQMFTPDKDETEYLLDDGSRMRVCICKDCKAGVDLNAVETKNNIMEAVINGWELETKGYVDEQKWTPERQKSYMAIYSQKKLDIHSEGLSNYVIEDRKKRLADIMKGDGVRP